MPLEFCILASGSSGNAALLRSPNGVMLIDLGIGPRTTAKRLLGTGVTVGDVSAVCLTHLDRDHFSPHWIATLIRQNIRVYCHAQKADQLARMAAPAQSAAFERLIQPFESSAFTPLDGLGFHPIHLAHDLLGSHGFLIEGLGYRIGYATDLGRIPARLVEVFRDLDLIALESNYDPAMQEQSNRPLFLKQRITSGKGHLSNHQALAAIKQILDRAQRLPDHIVLLHRSRQCNCPDLLRALFSQDPRIAPRLTLAEPFERSPWLRRKAHAPAKGEQLMLSF